MEEQLNTIELDEMKEQLSILRRKLEKETIVNERLIRTSMRDKLKAVKRRSYILCAVVLIACFGGWLESLSKYFSPYFTGVTVAFLLIAVVYELYCNHLLSIQNYISGNLIEEVRKLIRYKQLVRKWHWFSIPFFCVWFSWFLYESTMLEGSLGVGSTVGGIVGGIIGGIMGWSIYKKGQNTVSEVIEQIEELTGEKE